MISTEEIKKKSVSGVIALTSRTAILQLVSLAGNFFLSIFLTPEEFGIYFIVSAIVVFLSYFSDIGLAAALIQKKEVNQDDLASTFTVQQVLVLVFSAIVFFFSAPIASFYRLNEEGLLLFQALIVAFIFSSLKTIPSILLERKLEFQKLVVPQLVEVIMFYVVSVVLAAMGWGIKSFSVAVLLRGISGTVVLYIIQPWMPQIMVRRETLKKLLSTGVPFQLNSFLALVKDDLFTLYLGKVLPFTYVGYIGWAKKWAELPLRLIMDSIVRVTFPTYSRLQDNKEALSRGINKTFFFILLFILPISVGMVIVIEPFVSLVPKYDKWSPALFSFYLFVFSSIIAAISTPLVNALNAIGKIKLSLVFMVVWTLLTWFLTPFFLKIFGFDGFAVASVVISLTVIVVSAITKRYISFSLTEELKPSLIASIIMGGILVGARMILPNTGFSLVLLLIIGGVSYSGSYFLFFKEKLMHEINSVLYLIRKK